MRLASIGRSLTATGSHEEKILNIDLSLKVVHYRFQISKSI